MCLQNQAGDAADPGQVAGKASISVGVSGFASSRGNKGGDTDLGVLSVAVNDAHSRATVSVASARVGVSERCANGAWPDDEAVGILAFIVANNGDGRFLQSRADSTGTIGSLSPSGNVGFSANVEAGVSWVLETDRTNIVSANVDWSWELDESNISGQSVGVPVRMDVLLVGADLETFGLGDANIVSSQVDVKVQSTISAVSGSQNPLVGNQGSSTERSTADEEGSDPWELMRSSLSSVDDAGGIWGSANSTEVLGFPGSLVPQWDLFHSSGIAGNAGIGPSLLNFGPVLFIGEKDLSQRLGNNENS